MEHAVKDLEKEEANTIRAKVSLTLQTSKAPKNNLPKMKITTPRTLPRFPTTSEMFPLKMMR